MTKVTENIKGDPDWEGAYPEATAEGETSPPIEVIRKRFKDMVNQIKAIGTYQGRIYASALVLMHELGLLGVKT